MDSGKNFTPLSEKILSSLKRSSKFTGRLLLLALLFFILIGYLYYFALLINQKQKAYQKAVTAIPTNPVVKPSFDLKIISPTDRAVIEDNKLKVEGKTSAKATIILYTENDEASVESDSLGNFNAEIKLVPGINSLTITAFDLSGEEKSVTMDVVNDT
ncbi:MAG: hypothetical protein QHH09_03515 [Microgenomates group bacterium]|jgi:hypothetical protein|nr:hypothetical protein [Microgenomates group bacterium]